MKGALCVLADESQASEVLLCPTGPGEETSNFREGQGEVPSMVVDHDAATVRMTVDALTAFAFRELKALVFEGSDDTPHSDVA